MESRTTKTHEYEFSWTSVPPASQSPKVLQKIKASGAGALLCSGLFCNTSPIFMFLRETIWRRIWGPRDNVLGPLRSIFYVVLCCYYFVVVPAIVAIESCSTLLGGFCWEHVGYKYAGRCRSSTINGIKQKGVHHPSPTTVMLSTVNFHFRTSKSLSKNRIWREGGSRLKFS